MTVTVFHKGEHGMKPRASKERVVRPHGLREDPQPYHVRLLARVLNVQQFELVS